MRTVVLRVLTMLWLGFCAGIGSLLPVQAFPLMPPQEKLAGLTPGCSTLADAEVLHGRWSNVMPGNVESYVGGAAGTKAYDWSSGPLLGRPDLVVETSYGSSLVSTVMVNAYPGLGTSRGLTALSPDSEALRLYGAPDFAFECINEEYWFRELYYLDQGLLLFCEQVPGRPDWTITKIILTFPVNLRTTVALRERYALTEGHRINVSDITSQYRRVWAHMAGAPQ